MLDAGAALLQAAERAPDRLAVTAGAQRLTYAEWLDRALRLAGGLEGGRIATLLPNTLDAASLHWACQLAGKPVVPLNWRLKAGEIDYCLADAGADTVVFGPEAAAAVAASPRAQAIRRIEAGPALDALLRGPPAAPAASAEDWSVLLYTSGTTGRPKGVPRRHRAERAAAIAHVAQNRYAPGEGRARRHAALPYHGRAHAAGLGAGGRCLRLPAALRAGRGARPDRGRGRDRALPRARRSTTTCWRIRRSRAGGCVRSASWASPAPR